MNSDQLQRKARAFARIHNARHRDDQNSKEYWRRINAGLTLEANQLPASRFYLGELVEEFRNEGMPDAELFDIFTEFYGLKMERGRCYDR